MRPAILVIIMDFLVSSLLLFITGPESLPTPAGQGVRAVSPAYDRPAIAAMEAAWARETREALVARRLAEQQQALALLGRKSDDLQSAKTALESALAAERADAAQRARELADKAREAERLKQEQDKLAAAVREREAQLAAQRDALAARQKDLADKTREAERLRQEQDKLATAVREREALVASQQQSIADLTRAARALEVVRQQQDQAGRVLTDLRADQQTMVTNLAVLRAQGAAAQSQLAAIAAGQAGLAERLGALQGAQDRMDATLRAVHETAASLPAALRGGLEDLAATQRGLDGALAGLGESLATLRETGTPAEWRGVTDKLDALAAQHRALQESLATVITGRTDQLGAGLAGVRQGQDALQTQMKTLASKVEDLGATRPGPFRPFRDARLELRVALIEVFRGSDVTGEQLANYAAVVYPPLLSAGGKLWVAAGYRDLGLTWAGINPDLRHLFYRLAPRGRTGTSTQLKGAWHALADNPRVLLMAFQPTNDPALAAVGLTNPAPMAVLGRAALERRGPANLHLFKRSSEGLSFAMEASFDMTDPRYLVVRRAARPWAGILQRAFTNPNARAEPGDFVVTGEGAFVGVMVDEERCLVLDADPLAAGAQAIPLDSPAAFVEAVKQVRRALK